MAKRRSAAQKAATRKLVAMNKARAKGKHHKKKRRSAPSATSCSAKLRRAERSQKFWKRTAKKYAPAKAIQQTEAFVGPPEPERRALGFNYENLRDKRGRKKGGKKKHQKRKSHGRKGRAPKGTGPWHAFLRKHRGKGHTMKGLARMFRKTHGKKAHKKGARRDGQSRYDSRHREWAGERESHSRRVRAARRGARGRKSHRGWF